VDEGEFEKDDEDDGVDPTGSDAGDTDTVASVVHLCNDSFLAISPAKEEKKSSCSWGGLWRVEMVLVQLTQSC